MPTQENLAYIVVLLKKVKGNVKDILCVQSK